MYQKTLTFLFINLFLHIELFGQNAADIYKASSNFISTLSEEQKKQTIYEFNDSFRLKWTNLPVGLVPRPGIQYGSLSDTSRLALHRVFTSILSSQGYLKLNSIMALDDILNTLYQIGYERGNLSQDVLKMSQDLKWSHENYYLAIFGLPDHVKPWAIKFGGHHMALSATMKGNDISISPYFSGTDPSEVKSDKYAGLRVLSKEEDYGFMLLHMLSTSQKAKVILSKETPRDIITSPNGPQRIDQYYGLPGSMMTVSQKQMMELLINEYIHNFEHPIAHQFNSKIMKTGLNKVYFAWIGSQENNKPHYYILHGPDFIIEYDNVGFQNDGNHIHCILRQTGNEFGEDLLKQHYNHMPHQTIPNN